ADHICIEMFGKTHLGRFLENVISITKIIISRITNYQIWNVCPIQFISNSNDQMLNQSLIKPEKRQVNGINLMKGESGIEDRQLDVNHGLNGKEKKKNALYAKNFIKHLLEKTVMLKNTVRKNANPLLVLDVIKLNEIEDVYCINVPEIHHFSLSNGAIVHNSDAMRTLATGLHYVVNKNQSTSHNPSQYMQNRFAC
ncbi:MAG TPA: hypothetical protein VK462_10525, partial [Nitrososphaeraceae archaeon]|nr:hypothetical protein [Nitrososphaeraceae archaeon]